MEKDGLTCCFTGYRPQKFSFKLKAGEKEYTEFENLITEEILRLADEGFTTFISGMAMGFDIIAAECALTVREIFRKSSIKIICAIPYIEQAANFPAYWKEKYDFLLENCDEAVLISDNYHRNCFMARNRYMVDNSDLVLTYFDGKPGGTKNTVDYAKEKGRLVINLYEKTAH